MNHLICHIEYLIGRHDCVVMPGWGAFIASRVSAYYDEGDSIYHAPRRFVSFNPEINHDDGMIASSISRRESIPFEQASRIVADEIVAMKHQLSADGEISLGLVGKLVAQDGSTPMFEPSARFRQVQSMLFSELEISTLASRCAREANKTGETAQGAKRIKRFGLKIAKVAASLAVAVGIGYGLIAPIASSRHDNMAAVSATSEAFVSNSQTSIIPLGIGEKELKIAAPESGIATPFVIESAEHDTTAETTVVQTTENGVQTPRIELSDPYCLVVASLPTRAGAEKFVNENRAIELNILEQDGKFRVYAATGQSSSQAMAQLSHVDLSGKFKDAWVCRRK